MIIITFPIRHSQTGEKQKLGPINAIKNLLAKLWNLNLPLVVPKIFEHLNNFVLI